MKNIFTKIGRDFQNNYQKLQSKKNTSNCMFDGCMNKSINSHCFSESSMLRKIAVNSQLITPNFKRDDEATIREIVFEEVGIHDASIYKGFCLKHDALFNPIDKLGIKTLRDIFLQLYRSACYICFVGNMFNACEVKTFGAHILHNPNYDDKKIISHLKMVELFFDLLHNFEELDSPFVFPKNDSCSLKPFSDKVDLDMVVLTRRLNFSLPVAFQNNLTLNLDGAIFDLIFIIIPFEDTSLLIAASHESQIDIIHSRLRTDISALNLIESMFMNDANFFLSPNLFNSWPEGRRKIIIDDYKYINERRMFEEYDISLFDEVRIDLINKSQCDVKKEYNKITHLPLRSDIKSREENMNLYLLNHRDFRLSF